MDKAQVKILTFTEYRKVNAISIQNWVTDERNRKNYDPLEYLIIDYYLEYLEIAGVVKNVFLDKSIFDKERNKYEECRICEDENISECNFKRSVFYLIESNLYH